MSELAGLLEQVRAATGPDRVLDAALWIALGHDHTDDADWLTGAAGGRLDLVNGVTLPDALQHGLSGVALAWQIAPLTASIDAALTLVEAKLPGWPWLLRQTHDEHYFARLESPDFEDVVWEAGDKETRDITAGSEALGYGSSAPLAILATALSALLQQGEGK